MNRSGETTNAVVLALSNSEGQFLLDTITRNVGLLTSVQQQERNEIKVLRPVFFPQKVFELKSNKKWCATNTKIFEVDIDQEVHGILGTPEVHS